MKALPSLLRTWVEIDRTAIKQNYRVWRKLSGKHTLLMGVIKSNAYGHNIHEFAKELESLGADYLGVDSITEALALRKGGITLPILVLGFTLPAQYVHARKYNIILTISSMSQVEALRALPLSKIPLRVHLKVDTGMHRQGFQLPERETLFEVLLQLSPLQVRVEGCYTHFAEAKNPAVSGSTQRQIDEFAVWRTSMEDLGYTPLCHLGATGGALLYPESHQDMIRIGIGCYGLWPSEEARLACSSRITLSPVLSWRSVVGEVKSVKRGERVGYDFTERLHHDARLAVIPVGYWHGIPRALSSKGAVLIRGKRAPMVGRISMDMIVVDVTEIPKVTMGDRVTLIGRDGKESISAEELARGAGTTAYEIVTRLNPLMERIYG
jgi:alanine racemase